MHISGKYSIKGLLLVIIAAAGAIPARGHLTLPKRVPNAFIDTSQCFSCYLVNDYTTLGDPITNNDSKPQYACMLKTTHVMFHLAVLCDSLRCGAYGIP